MLEDGRKVDYDADLIRHGSDISNLLNDDEITPVFHLIFFNEPHDFGSLFHYIIVFPFVFLSCSLIRMLSFLLCTLLQNPAIEFVLRTIADRES